MSQSALPRELALAIGLATKALPGACPKDIINLLIDTVGLPFTSVKFNALSFKLYRQAVNKYLRLTYSRQQIYLSFSHLQACKGAHKNAALPLQPYHRGDMPHSIRIAVTSQDGIHINGHFNSCKEFYIYQVSAAEYRLIILRPADNNKDMTAEEKQFYRAQILQDCHVLYVQSIGAASVAKVIKYRVHPIKLKNEPLIIDIVEQLQHVLQTSPPPWLAKTMGLSEVLNPRRQEELI